MKLLQRIEALERAVALAGPRPSVEAQGHLRTLLRALTEALLWSTPSEALGQRAVRAAVSARIALGELPQPSLRQVDLEPRRRSADDVPSQSPEVLAIEAEKLLRSLPSKGRLLTRKDIAGFIQVGRALLSLEEQSQISYVALGRSPAVLVAFLRRALGMKIVDLPLGGLSEGVVPRLEVVTPLLRRCLPLETLAKVRRVVIIDYAYGGKSLLSVAKVVQDYANEHLGADAPEVLIAPITWKAGIRTHALSVLKDFDVGTRAAHRLLKVLFTEIDKETLSPFASLKYATLVQDPEVDVAALARPEQARALDQAIELAIGLRAKRAEIEEYLQPRKRKTNKFSLRSLGFGYDRARGDEEAWVNKLRSESQREYGTNAQLTRYVDAEVRSALASPKPRERRYTRAEIARNRRFALVLLISVVLALCFWLFGGFGSNRK